MSSPCRPGAAWSAKGLVRPGRRRGSARRGGETRTPSPPAAGGEGAAEKDGRSSCSGIDDDGPERAEACRALALGVADRGVAREEVQRMLVVRDLHRAVLALRHAERSLDTR